jgi:hypothetical protein
VDYTKCVLINEFKKLKNGVTAREILENDLKQERKTKLMLLFENESLQLSIMKLNNESEKNTERIFVLCFSFVSNVYF